jgi:ribokinase
MADIAVFGTAAADVVLRVPAIPPVGGHVSAASLGWRLGGGSANVALALAEDGHDVELVGPFSTDPMGDELLAGLARAGVRTSHSFRVNAPSPRALVLLDAGGERTIVGVDEGFSREVYPLTEVPAIGPVDAIYVETYHRFPTTIGTDAPDALLLTTPAGAGAGPLPADLLVGSESDYPDGWLSSPYEHARAAAGPRLRWVVVTRGHRGADAYGPDRHVHVDAVPVEQLDTTGAGDAFASGLLSAFLAGLGIEAAMDRAAHRAATTVGSLRSFEPAAAEALGRTWPQL